MERAALSRAAGSPPPLFCVGAVLVLRMVPLGNMKLKTVELRSNDARRPCACSWLIKASTSPCEKADGFDPLRICEGLKVVVIGLPWKYWTMTLFKCGSDIAAANV